MPQTVEPGLFDKFTVFRNDGRDAPGREKEGAEYLVLDYAHDPDAWLAAASYAITSWVRRPALAKDLAGRLTALAPGMYATPRGRSTFDEVFGPECFDKSAVLRLLVTLATTGAINEQEVKVQGTDLQEPKPGEEDQGYAAARESCKQAAIGQKAGRQARDGGPPIG